MYEDGLTTETLEFLGLHLVVYSNQEIPVKLGTQVQIDVLLIKACDPVMRACVVRQGLPYGLDTAKDSAMCQTDQQKRIF